MSIPRDLKAIDRRDWQLWVLCFAIIAALSAGFLGLHLSLPAKERSWERTVLFGETVLVLLAVAYFIQKRSELSRLRVKLIREQLHAAILRDRYDTLGNTLAFTTRVGEFKDETQILTYAVEQTLVTLRADHCMIGLHDENEIGPPPLKARVAREGLDEASAPATVWETASAWVVARDQSLLLAGKATPPEARELIDPDSNRMVIAAPVRLGGRPGGVLLVAQDAHTDPDRRCFGDSDRHLLEIIANAAAAAVHNCRMAGRLKRRRDQLRESLKRLRLAQPGVILGERLKAMEELVDKVAHYIANPLTTISGYAQLLNTQGLEPDVKRCLDTIGEEVDRCNQAINDLKAFAHRPPSEPRSTDLNQLLHQALFLKAYRFDRLALDVRFEPDPEVGLAVIDPVQVQQAFLNVLTDIENAVEGHDKQRLVVRTENRESTISIQFRVRSSEPPDGDRRPIWSPFSFASDDPDEGTSLARDILFAVIRAHGGQILYHFDSENGSTDFTMDLPRVIDQTPEEPISIDSAPVDGLPTSGRGVLVVDDEERILNIFKRVLTKEGYVVKATVRGREALELLEENAFDAIILDYHMPDVHGRVIAEHLIQNRSDLRGRLILTTGDDLAQDFQRLAREAGAATLAKPFQIQEMLSIVNATARPEARNG